MRHGHLVLPGGLGYKLGSCRCFKRRRGALVRLCCSMVYCTIHTHLGNAHLSSYLHLVRFYQDKDIALLCYPDKHQRQTFVGTFVVPSVLLALFMSSDADP